MIDIMSKSKKNKKHFMDDNYESYRKVRKSMPKPSRIIDDSVDDKFDWKKEINKDEDWKD